MAKNTKAKPAADQTNTDANTGTPDAGAATTTTTSAPKDAPVITAISADIPFPVKAPTLRGSKTLYPFASLVAVGQSFGVTNRTAKGMASIVSNQNRKPSGIVKKDANGATVFKMTEIKDAAGNVTAKVPSGEPEMVPGPQYVVADVKEGGCRVWLKSLPETPAA